MSRIGEGILSEDVELSLTLDRYQQIMGLPINAFNGLNLPTEVPRYECSTIWTQSSRDYLAMYIAMAEEMREQELGYHLAPKYLVDEEQDYGIPVLLNRKHLVVCGVKTTSTIEAGVALDLGPVAPSAIDPPNDPVVITITTSVATDEIVVFYPDEDVEIRPSSISAAAGIVTIRIPRARLVDNDYNDDREDHLNYYNNDYFLTTVDVKRVYTNTTAGISIVWGSVERVLAGVQTYPNANETVQSAVVQVLGKRAKRISEIHVYAGECLAYCILPTVVRVSYLSGRQSSMRTELDTARMAHVLMPNVPCTCPYVEQYWIGDRLKDASGLVTPYGSESGAVKAWISDSRAKIGMGGKFPRTRR